MNCITPAAARTRIFDQMSEEHIGYMLAKIPRGRFLLPDEVAAMVAFLASRREQLHHGGRVRPVGWPRDLLKATAGAHLAVMPGKPSA